MGEKGIAIADQVGGIKVAAFDAAENTDTGVSRIVQLVSPINRLMQFNGYTEVPLLQNIDLLNSGKIHSMDAPFNTLNSSLYMEPAYAGPIAFALVQNGNDTYTVTFTVDGVTAGSGTAANSATSVSVYGTDGAARQLCGVLATPSAVSGGHTGQIMLKSVVNNRIDCRDAQAVALTGRISHPDDFISIELALLSFVRRPHTIRVGVTMAMDELIGVMTRVCLTRDDLVATADNKDYGLLRTLTVPVNGASAVSVVMLNTETFDGDAVFSCAVSKI